MATVAAWDFGLHGVLQPAATVALARRRRIAPPCGRLAYFGTNAGGKRTGDLPCRRPKQRTKKRISGPLRFGERVRATNSPRREGNDRHLPQALRGRQNSPSGCLTTINNH